MATVVDWNEVNNMIHDALILLQYQNQMEVSNFLDWFISLDKKQFNIQDYKTKRWVVDGIPHMKAIVKLFNDEITAINKIIDTILTSRITQSYKAQGLQSFYKNLQEVYDTIIYFVGCRNDFGKWYLSLLQTYPDISKANVNYFMDMCNKIRISRNKLSQ